MKANSFAIVGFIISLVALLAPLEGEIKPLAMGVGVPPLLWRGVELYKAHFGNGDGNKVWIVANAIGLLIPITAYGILVWTGQDALTWDGVLTSIGAGAMIATAADGIHRIADTKAKEEPPEADNPDNPI